MFECRNEAVQTDGHNNEQFAATAATVDQKMSETIMHQIQEKTDKQYKQVGVYLRNEFQTFLQI